MCVSKFEIRLQNGQKMFVPCGHCPACQQENANRRTMMIRNQTSLDGYVTLFVTLTYSNRYIPFISKQDFLDCLFDHKDYIQVPVYRDYDVRRVRFQSYRQGIRKRYIKDKVKYLDVDKELFDSIGSVRLDLPDGFNMSDLRGLRYRVSRNYIRYAEHPDRVGIIYFKDIQDFYKRLKQNYERTYRRPLDFKSFHVAEYGSQSLRPHFHALLQVKKEDVERMYSEIPRAWRYCDRKRLLQYIQVAYNAAAYVSSYVNTHSYLPKIYNSKDICPKSSHSRFYGLNNVHFTPFALSQKIYSGDLHYFVQMRSKEGVFTNRFLVPKYVLSTYFPKFKGFSKFTTRELASIYKDPQILNLYARRLEYDSHFIGDDDNLKGSTFYERFNTFRLFNPPSYNMVFDDSKPIRLRFNKKRDEFFRIENSTSKDLVSVVHTIYNARNRFCRAWYVETGEYPDFDFYAHLASMAWTVWYSNLLKDSYDIPEKDRYLNCDNVNSNEFDLGKHNDLLVKYSKYDKMKKHNNLCMSLYSSNF